MDGFKWGLDKLITSVKIVFWVHGHEVAKKLLSLEAEEALQQKDVCICVTFVFPFPEELLVDYDGHKMLEKVDP